MTPPPPPRRPRTLLLAATTLALIAASAAWADAPIGERIGVNVVNPQRQPAAQQDATIAELARHGVELIRAPLEVTWAGQTSLDPAIDFVIRAWESGISTTLIVGLAYPREASRRAAQAEHPEMWPVPSLSDADPGLLRDRFAQALARLDDAGVVLAGLEVGNEINWTAFNGAFRLPGTGRVYGYEDLYRDPEAMRLAAGLRVYIENLRVVRRLRDASRVNGATPIISAGLADPGPPRPSSSVPLDAISLDATLRYLRDHGLDALVDAYGVHTYPGQGPIAEARLGAIAEQAFGQCAPPPLGKPCWVTEWGVAASHVSCDDDDDMRVEAMRQATALLARLMEAGKVEQAYYYQWNGDRDPYGVFRCGRLTAGGRVVLSPP